MEGAEGEPQAGPSRGYEEGVSGQDRKDTVFITGLQPAVPVSGEIPTPTPFMQRFSEYLTSFTICLLSTGFLHSPSLNECC